MNLNAFLVSSRLQVVVETKLSKAVFSKSMGKGDIHSECKIRVICLHVSGISILVVSCLVRVIILAYVRCTFCASAISLCKHIPDSNQSNTSF